MKQSRKKCPSLKKMENCVIHNLLLALDFEIDKTHLETCPECRAEYENLIRFYQIFVQEIELPISDSVSNFVNRIEAPGLKISTFLLKPVAAPESGAAIFSAECVQPPPDKLDPETVEQSEIVLRIIQKEHFPEECFTLKSGKTNFYKNVELRFIDLKKSLFTNEIGLGKFIGIDVKDLNQAKIQILPKKKTQNK